MSQLLTGHSRSIRFFVAALLMAAAGCRATPTSNKGSGSPAGGELLVSIRTEPRNFTRLVDTREETTDLVALLIHAGLVRINRDTDEVEPWLAESWTPSADGRQYTMKLRPNVQFSDGHPLSSDDVVFSFEAAYASGFGDSLHVGGKPLAVTAVDPLTVTVTFPQAFAPGVRILDNLVILPRHKLSAALKNNDASAISQLLTPLSASTNQVAGARTAAGVSMSAFDTAVAILQAQSGAETDAVAGLGEVDEVTAASNLALAQRSLDAALTAAAQGFQLSLLDKVR